MGLTAVEKCAGRWFREGAEEVLAQALADDPDSAPCSAQVRFYRHECPEQQGRTRSFPLNPVTLTSPEIWVTWREGMLTVITPDAAQYLLDKGEVVEFEVVLKGKFSFTWIHGGCHKCGLTAVSREGILADVRAAQVGPSGDLAVFTQPQLLRVTKGVLREHE